MSSVTICDLRHTREKNEHMKIDHAAILNSINQYVYVKDKNGVYLYGNDSFAKISALDAKQIVGKTDSDLIWGAQAEYCRADDKRVLNGNSLINVERYQLHEHGLTKILLNLMPYHSANGDLIGVLGHFFDFNQHLMLETKGVFDKNRLYLEFVPEWLSSTEIRVCFYLLHGFSAARISEKTGTTISTVRFHINNIKNKMQCKNKNEITEVAMRTGIAWKIFSLQHQIDD